MVEQNVNHGDWLVSLIVSLTGKNGEYSSDEMLEFGGNCAFFCIFGGKKERKDKQQRLITSNLVRPTKHWPGCHSQIGIFSSMGLYSINWTYDGAWEEWAPSLLR